MQKRTQDEINRQIEGLKKEKENLPSHSAFGDDNWGKIDAQLDVLEGKKTPGEFEEDELFFAAEEAEQWLDGETDEDLFSTE